MNNNDNRKNTRMKVITEDGFDLDVWEEVVNAYVEKRRKFSGHVDKEAIFSRKFQEIKDKILEGKRFTTSDIDDELFTKKEKNELLSKIDSILIKKNTRRSSSSVESTKSTPSYEPLFHYDSLYTSPFTSSFPESLAPLPEKVTSSRTRSSKADYSYSIDVTSSETTKAKTSNPYGFNYDEVEEEDKLEEYINADLPVFVHGKSGCGKSARIKEMDPDCEIIYLGSARPEVLLGKSIVINDELQDVPPTWYISLCAKCQKEPDKIHILFFDEITNATPALQGYAFNIILDKSINGKWKLPENARVVAAGNEDKESLSANKLAEPLFRRFNHIYIETVLEKWLLWASKHNIHPAIYAYVASKGDGKDQVLRTECDGKNPCVDPRKWEMASKILYRCKNPRVLTATLGEKITNDFILFCKQPVITLEQVLTDNYDHNMGRLSIDEGYATLIGLAACNEKDIAIVRAFVKAHVIPDQYQNFVMMWTRGDSERLDKIHELDLEEQMQSQKGGK